MKKNLLIVALPLLFVACEKPAAKSDESKPPAETAVQNLPDPAPPFQPKEGKRQEPKLKVSTQSFRGGPNFEQPSFWVGNKRVGVREASGGSADPEDPQIVGVMVDGRGLFRFTFWGGQKDSGMGYPFALKEGTSPELITDPVAGTITYRKPFMLPTGETSVFSYTLKSLGDSQVQLSWDLGISQEKLDSLPPDFSGVDLWIISAETYRSEPMLINGKTLALTDPDKLTNEATPLGEGQGLKVEFAPDKPLQSVSFELSKKYSYSIAEASPGPGRHEFIIRTNNRPRESKGEVVIDLGVAAVQDAAAPAPVADIDFWQRDAMDVSRPGERNLMPNGSFEQGLRYWTWWWGGGPPFVERELPKYSVADGGKFGGKALLIREGQAQVMQSSPIPVTKDKAYTASFYAKAAQPGAQVQFGVMSPIRGSKLEWMGALQRPPFQVGTEWQRFSLEFTPDKSAVVILMGSNQEVLIDGIQIEEGGLTDFNSPIVEGFLATADPDNMLAAGQAMDASFHLTGQPGLSGEVELTVFNYYREKLAQETFPFVLDAQGTAKIALPFDAQKFGVGVFVVKAEYRVGANPPLRDYYRFSIMDFLKNEHPTKDLFGDLMVAYRLPRGDTLTRNFMRWGFGSSTYNLTDEGDANLLKKYGITNLLTILVDSGEEGTKFSDEVMSWTEVTPDREQAVEDFSARIAAQRPWCTNWAFSTETEYKSALLRKENYSEWAKVQLAAVRGIKRGNPQAKVLFDGGTSGFNRLRGYRETEGYLAATQGKIKWDAIATHPYGDLDGTAGFPNDLDVETARLIELAKKYGYGPETPIDFTEGFNTTDFYLPEWGLGAGSDAYDNFSGVRPTYDFGWREFTHAAWVARTYLTALKYWPHVRSFNIWVSVPYVDMYFAPLSMCKVPNTLGHLFNKPTFKADVRPAAGVRGYVFEDEAGRGVAAIWCALEKVDAGLERGPEMQVNFGDDVPEFFDLMGNPRTVAPKNGEVSIQLTSAPLFLRTGKGGAEKLAAALNGAAIAGAGSALKIAVQPTIDGTLDLSAHNLTNRILEGDITTASGKVPFKIESQGTESYPLSEHFPTAPGKLYSWKQELAVNFANGKTDKVNWDTSWFYVPHTAQPLPLDPSAPEWNSIPAIPVTNVYINRPPGLEPVKAGYAGDLEATFQLAWDAENLYLRVNVKDDHFQITDATKWSPEQLFMNDGCAEIYFDAGANGRSNPGKGFDLDDYRYDFSINATATDGAAAVFRLREPEHQLAGGIDMPSKQEAAEHVKTQFVRTADGYAYVMIFPQRYIEPLHLEKGWRAGFGLYLHDNDDPQKQWPGKGLSLATETGAHCDQRPNLWPIMVLGD